jgi:hypothetical protein
MGARAIVLSLVVLGGCVYGAGAAEEMMVIKVYSGIEHKGIVEKVDDDTITIRTAYGLKTIRRTDIITSRKDLSADERAKIASDVAASKPAAAEPRAKSDIRIADSTAMPRRSESIARSSSGSPADRMMRGLDRRVSMELVDSSLTDAVDFLQNLTGLTIIIDPKVREMKPTVSLRVSDMDAGTALKWITQLTDTYAEVRDQAIFITHKKSEVAENEERTEIMNLAASMKADVDLPPEGQPLTDTDRMKIAMQLWAKEEPKPQDFPGPNISIGASPNNENPFQFVAPGN